MKKRMLIALVLSDVLSYRTFAATGNASDGLVGVFAVIGFLLLVVALSYMYDYLKKNGKKLINKAFAFSKKVIVDLVAMLNKSRSGFHDPMYVFRWKI